MVAGKIENEIVARRAGCKVFLGIFDDAVGPERSNQVRIARAANGGDVRTENFGKLHCECANAARCAVNEDILAGLNPSVFAKTLQCSESRNGAGGCIFERDIFRFGRQLRLRRERVFRKCTAAVSEHSIARLELLDRGADGCDDASTIDPWALELGPAKQQAKNERAALEHVDVKRIDRGGVDFDQDFLIAWNRLLNLLAGEDVRRAIFAIHDCFHESTSFPMRLLELPAQGLHKCARHRRG